MNTKQMIIAVAMLAVTGTVFAQTSEYTDPNEGFVSTKTRAQVQAELGQSSPTQRTEYPVPDANFASTKTRAQVQSELAQTGPQGLLAQDQEWNYPAVVSPASSALKAQERPAKDAASIGMMENCTKMMG
jgi:hypothetical protein